jgi:phosphatidylserine/phosphatidylglycerophosphate/cardiolipin synthase-like enzyme
MELIRPVDTCWRVEAARRVAFLVDYQDYYTTLAAALARATRQVLLIGWSFDPRTRLAPDGVRRPGSPDEIGCLLIELAKQKPGLDIRVLVWRSALPISATQEGFPHRAKAWFRNTGVDFRLDGTVPFGACHHQKVIVIDDTVAFCGSGDICGDRWDTTAHLDRDARRRNPAGGFHAPRHEVMILAEGPIARALGDLARVRWRDATGETLAPSPALAPGESPWPDGLAADVSDTRLAIARTLPAWKGRPEVGEISALTAEAIAAATQALYVENQYFTSPVVAEALAARLGEPQGPQVVLVSTHRSPSYFDQLTMDRTRAVFIWRLRAADIFGRLRVLAPFTAEGAPIIVHAKTMVVDDILARVSSANLNNRSQGFDTECELDLEAERDDERTAVTLLRDRLVGHWLGRPAADVAAARTRTGSLIGAMEDLNRHGRLRPIEPTRLGPLGEFTATFHLGDPVSVADSWAPLRRRDRLFGQARAARRDG